MKDELTTSMHSEFLGDEYSKEEWAAMGVFGAVNRGVTLKKALAEYGLTEKSYKKLCDILFL